MPDSGKRQCRGCTKFDFTIAKKKRPPNPLSRHKGRQAPQNEGVVLTQTWKEKSPVVATSRTHTAKIEGSEKNTSCLTAIMLFCFLSLLCCSILFHVSFSSSSFSECFSCVLVSGTSYYVENGLGRLDPLGVQMRGSNHSNQSNQSNLSNQPNQSNPSAVFFFSGGTQEGRKGGSAEQETRAVVVTTRLCEAVSVPRSRVLADQTSSHRDVREDLQVAGGLRCPRGHVE